MWYAMWREMRQVDPHAGAISSYLIPCILMTDVVRIEQCDRLFLPGSTSQPDRESAWVVALRSPWNPNRCPDVRVLIVQGRDGRGRGRTETVDRSTRPAAAAAAIFAGCSGAGPLQSRILTLVANSNVRVTNRGILVLF